MERRRFSLSSKALRNLSRFRALLTDAQQPLIKGWVAPGANRAKHFDVTTALNRIDQPDSQVEGGVSARLALREATRQAHERVDRLFAPLKLDSAEGYATFLGAQAAAFVPVEAGLDAAGADDILADWPRRRRAADLLGDLARLNQPAPAPAAAPIFHGEAQILGAVYVLEGSRLGGTLMKRKVPEGWPTAFLSAADPSLWRSLTAYLDARLTTPSDLQAAIGAAASVFAVFERAARDRLGAAAA